MDGESKIHCPHWNPITQTAAVNLDALTKLELFLVLDELTSIMRATPGTSYVNVLNRRMFCVLGRFNRVVRKRRYTCTK